MDEDMILRAHDALIMWREADSTDDQAEAGSGLASALTDVLAMIGQPAPTRT